MDGRDTVQLTSGTDVSYVSPEWAPDGNYVVVSRGGGSIFGLEKLWLYHVRGGRGLPLVERPPALRMLGAAFGPDARYIWFAQRTGQWQYNAILPQYQLGIYDRETGTRTTMSARYGSALRPAISPDGRWLAYGSRHDAETGLRLRELATGEERWLVHPIQRDDQESRATMDVLPGYSWTPDSRAIVMSYGGEIWRVPLDGPPVKIPFTVDAEVAVGPEVRFEYPISDSATFTLKQIRDAVPSPDGRRVAFTALDRLYVVDLPNGAPRRLTDQAVGEYHPTWSPDGAMIAYVSWDDREGHIMKVRASGGTPTRLTRVAAYYQRTVWSPDGKRIVAIRAAARDLKEAVDPFVFDGLGAEFVWIPAEGGDVRAKEGISLSFTMVHPSDLVHAEIAQMIKEEWAAIGVNVELQAVPYDQLATGFLIPRKYQAALVDLNLSRTPDPDPYPFWHQAEATGGQNYSQWDDRAASEYLEQARVTTDYTLRTRLYRNFQVVFAKELPALPLFAPVYSYGVDSEVQGVQVAALYDPSDRLATFNSWYLLTRRALEQTAVPTAGP